MRTTRSHSTEEEARRHQSVGFLENDPDSPFASYARTKRYHKEHVLITREIVRLAEKIHLNALKREREGGKTMAEHEETRWDRYWANRKLFVPRVIDEE